MITQNVEEFAPEQIAFNFYKSYTKSVEILFRDGYIYRVFFPLQPVCKHLSSESKENFSNNISRSSQKQKLIGLIQEMSNFFNEMEYLSYLHNLPIKFTTKWTRRFENIATVVAIMINYLILTNFKRLIRHDLTVIAEIDHSTRSWLKYLGLTHLLLSSLWCVSFLVINT